MPEGMAEAFAWELPRLVRRPNARDFHSAIPSINERMRRRMKFTDKIKDLAEAPIISRELIIVNVALSFLILIGIVALTAMVGAKNGS